MKSITTILAVIALSACATTNSSQQATTQASSKSIAQSVESASADCSALYASYETTMAQFQPAKKGMLERGLSLGGAATNIFAGKLIGSGVNPNTILKARQGIAVANELNGTGNFQNMINATSALSATQEAFKQSDALGCDRTVLASMAAKNS